MGRDQEEQTVAHGGTELAHFKNFIDCVTSRNKEDLNAPIEEGHISVRMYTWRTRLIGWAGRSTSIQKRSRLSGMKKRCGFCATAIEAIGRLSLCLKKSEGRHRQR